MALLGVTNFSPILLIKNLRYINKDSEADEWQPMKLVWTGGWFTTKKPEPSLTLRIVGLTFSSSDPGDMLKPQNPEPQNMTFMISGTRETIWADIGMMDV